MDKKEENEIRELLREHKKRKHFVEIITRKSVYIPLIVLFVYLIDNKDINVVGWLITVVKKIAGM